MLPPWLIVGLTLLVGPGIALAGDAKSDAAARGRLVEAYGKSPLSFEANQGQTDAPVRFLSRAAGYTLFLTGDEAVLALRSRQSSVVSSQLQQTRHYGLRTPNRLVRSSVANRQSSIENAESQIPNPESRMAALLRLKLVGANPTPEVRGLDELPGQSNYFIGNDPKKWRTNVPNYARVKYENVYRGVDLVYYGNQSQLEYDFVVAPGADPRAIALEIGTGNSKSENGKSLVPNPASRTLNPADVRIDSDGDLVITTDSGEVRFHKPVVYQLQSKVDSRQLTVAGAQRADNRQSAIDNRQFLDGWYVLRRAKGENRNSTIVNRQSTISNLQFLVGFEIASYDPTRPLIIDPVLSYSTFLGGGDNEIGYGIVVDAEGNAYVAGSTGSIDFPTANPLQASDGGDFDAFVTKVNATGTALVYSTYLGGTGFDRATGIALDSSGSVYITGMTASNNFPTTTGAFQAAFGGGTCGTVFCSDAFVTKLKADGSALVYSTYLGGGDSDFGQGIAVDSGGNAYVTGSTLSTNFPTVTPPAGCQRRKLRCLCDEGKAGWDGTGLLHLSGWRRR